MNIIFKDGHRYVEIESEDGAYWFEVPQMKDGPITVIETLDDAPLYEISVLPKEVNSFIYGLLEAKRLSEDE